MTAPQTVRVLPAQRERAAAYQRAETLSAALRAMRNAPQTAFVRPDQIAALEVEHEAAWDAAEALFRHVPWCHGKPVVGRELHSCMSDAPYVDGAHGVRPGGPVPTASAVAWAREEDGLLSVHLHLLSDGDAAGGEGWFDADAARALAAQLTAAADLIDGGAR